MKPSFLILLMLPFAAHAEEEAFPEFFCASAAAIQPPSQYCEDNLVFVRAGEECLQRLRNQVNAESETVKKLFSTKAKDRQAAGFHESSFDHQKASLRLERLIRLTKKTALELDTYFDKVYFPVDFEMDSVNGGDPEGYVMSRPCYGETVKSIGSIIDDVIEIGRELTAAKNTADSIAGQLGAREGGLDSASGAAPVKGGKSGAGPRGQSFGGKSRHKESTITGDIKPAPDLTKPASKP